MIGALVEQGVEVYRLDQELHGLLGQQVLHKSGNETGRGGGTLGIAIVVQTPPVPPVEIPAGSYIVFLHQPYRQNVLALFEPQVYPDRTTAAGEAERPYDVAGWTLPMMMGVESRVVTSIREPSTGRKLTLIKTENDVRRDLGVPLWVSDKSPIANPIKPGVRIAIYQAARGNMDEGWTRYVFDLFNAPYQSVRDQVLNQSDLRSQFDVVVLPSEQIRPSADSDTQADAARGISDQGYLNLARFVDDGGALVCFDAS